MDSVENNEKKQRHQSTVVTEENSSSEQPQSPKRKAKEDLLFKVDDIPPWYLCIVLGLQQFLTMFGGTVTYPLIIERPICMEGDDVGQGELISTVVFISGLSTILQSTLGVRLPIIQSISATFLTPLFVLMTLYEDRCPFLGQPGNNTSLIAKGSEEHRAIWQKNMCLLQGCLMVASMLPIVMGFSGIVGLVMRFVGPLTVAPTICLIGLSLFNVATDYGSPQWYICFMTIFLITLFSQYLRKIGIPVPWMKEKLMIFELFPILLAIAVSWIICVILTETGALPEEGWGSQARTDTRISVLRKSDWFRFPYPGQWGVPEVTVAGVVGMMAALLASMVESVGDYYACARLAGAAPPPASAINRGIGVEGTTCLLAGAWGAGGGTTSYSQNIGAISITRVGSRTVAQVAGIIMVILGCLGKFGALFVTLPDPVVGGLFYVMFGIITAVGVSNLQFVDLNSPRNLFVFGVSVFFGLSVSNWMAANQNAIDTGSEIADQICQVLLGTSMFLGGLMAFVLDNTIPGTDEERGLIHWNQTSHSTGAGDLSTYNLPFIQPFLNRILCLRYVPFCPNFVLDKRSCYTDVDGSLDVEVEEGSGQENLGYQGKDEMRSEQPSDSTHL